ncbi:ROK family transcriptional regulator [Oharaeibacter diazotrophicus]|uniref:Putative NBD/HSP70 family sugar kinase n=1 Tax=Oharaeibacter diazotrophicus TaxID=1920512 RepID=A0A4V3CW81_9HYPH|nr:ROK family transcriptional regulator [Oharaeibacter diazotrophicus]TDP85328.1 putative NBD/HSP70 family sugar kinase [Oharaeibacter diazotrophicus]BBE74298.1 N-acetylglucosamine repressor [Pleomorphomonas sp. SM30]GLS76011.1 sugar kinase [Oharaeibacter diazotrophicus]
MTGGRHLRTAAYGKADSDHVRRQNRSLVLSTLRRLAPIARVDLGVATGLSPATITAITADLIAEGLVETVPDETADLDDAPARRGRPRVMLRLDPRAALVLGVKLSTNHVTLLLADFGGTLRARRDLSPRTIDRDRDGFGAMLVELVGGFLAEEGVPVEHLAEITVAAQGFVDTRSGTLMWSPAARERNIPIVAPLEAAFGRSCTISNDANMIAQALHTVDPATYDGTFAVVFVDYGVGMGLFVAGRLHHGADGSAAEFGHMNHMPGGPLCRCGRRGCLEAFTADYAIAREARGLPPDTDPLVASPSAGELAALEAAAHGGDARLAAVYDGVGTALGYGLARLMALVNPSRIVLTGASTRAYPLFRPAMEAAIDAALVEDLRRFTVVEALPWDRDMIATGLISDALRRLDHDVFSQAVNARRFRA